MLKALSSGTLFGRNTKENKNLLLKEARHVPMNWFLSRNNTFVNWYNNEHLNKCCFSLKREYCYHHRQRKLVGKSEMGVTTPT